MTGPTSGRATSRMSGRSDVVDVSAQTGVDFKAGGTHHLNFGGGYRFKGVQWSYLAQRPGDDPYQENHFNAFVQDQWDMNPKLSLVLAYRLDRHPLLAAEGITPGGLVQSASGTLLFEPRPDHVIGHTGFENEPGSYFGMGTELSAKWSPADGVDLRANYSYEKMFACRVTASGGCTRDQTVPGPVSATLANTAQHKVFASAQWRTSANFVLGLVVCYVAKVN